MNGHIKLSWTLLYGNILIAILLGLTIFCMRRVSNPVWIKMTGTCQRDQTNVIINISVDNKYKNSILKGRTARVVCFEENGFLTCEMVGNVMSAPVTNIRECLFKVEVEAKGNYDFNGVRPSNRKEIYSGVVSVAEDDFISQVFGHLR